MKDWAIIIDGNAILYKSYYATQRDNLGESFQPTLIAFSKIIQKLRFFKNRRYRYLVVVFDSSKSSFRTEKYELYKQNRPKTPFALLENFDTVKALSKKLGFYVITAPKPYEGDDVIASLSSIFSSNNVGVDVFSTDADLLQLVSEDISVFLAKPKGKIIENNFLNFSNLNEGLIPEQIPYFKALAGDSSDNYKGVAGIGSKTAIQLITEHGDIDNIYLNLDSIKEKYRNSLLESKKDVYLFLELALLVRDIRLSDDLTTYESDSWVGKSGS